MIKFHSILFIRARDTYVDIVDLSILELDYEMYLKYLNKRGHLKNYLKINIQLLHLHVFT
jgi:hypothetical protein